MRAHEIRPAAHENVSSQQVPANSAGWARSTQPTRTPDQFSPLALSSQAKPSLSRARLGPGQSVPSITAQHLLHLQQHFGNRYVQRLLAADASGQSNGVMPYAEQAVAEAASTSSGHSLPPELSGRFGQALGANLDAVRIHTGSKSAQASTAVGARAFAMGQDIHFNQGEYNPGSSTGQHLIAHEVAHTVQQQGAAPPSLTRLEVSHPTDPLEREADLAAEHMMSSPHPGLAAPQSHSTPGAFRTLQRQATPAPAATHAAPPQTATPQTAPPQAATPQTASPAAAPAAARPTKAELVSIADTAINAEYASAARDGLSDFESDLGSSSDFGPVLTALAGNIIWAAACFTTGELAFAISLAGIGVGTAAPATSGSVDRSLFHQRAADKIDGITRNLLNQVARVTSDIDQKAAAGNWDDFKTRHELMLRLLKPDYIATAEGGLPTVNRAAIAHQIRIELLILANTYGPGIISAGGGSFIYDYNVSDHSESHGFWPVSSTNLTPVSQWKFQRDRTELYIPQGESSAHAAFTRIPLIQPADIPFQKTLYVHSADVKGDLIIYLDAQNNITNVQTYGVFEDFGEAPHEAYSRSRPKSDPVGAARAVVAAIWQGTGGRPAWVRGSDLGFASMPGRSRATR